MPGAIVLVVGVLILAKRFSNELSLAAVALCILVLIAITLQGSLVKR